MVYIPEINSIKLKMIMMDYRKEIVTEISASILAVEPLELQAAVSRIYRSGRIFCDGLGAMCSVAACHFAKPHPSSHRTNVF